jgi:hypothetical protein
MAGADTSPARALIYTIAGSIASSVEAQGVAASEIARNVSETAHAVNHGDRTHGGGSAEAIEARENATGLD